MFSDLKRTISKSQSKSMWSVKYITQVLELCRCKFELRSIIVGRVYNIEKTKRHKRKYTWRRCRIGGRMMKLEREAVDLFVSKTSSILSVRFLMLVAPCLLQLACICSSLAHLTLHKNKGLVKFKSSKLELHGNWMCYLITCTYGTDRRHCFE